jgi:hypothetical protein
MVATHTSLLPVRTLRSAPPAGRTCLTGQPMNGPTWLASRAATRSGFL